jgi:hypothetical protein
MTRTRELIGAALVAGAFCGFVVGHTLGVTYKFYGVVSPVCHQPMPPEPHVTIKPDEQHL